MAVIECVPNVSEGRRLDVIERMKQALVAVPGMRVLDVQSDATHNRSVFTLAEGAAAAAPEASRSSWLAAEDASCLTSTPSSLISPTTA